MATVRAKIVGVWLAMAVAIFSGGCGSDVRPLPSALVGSVDGAVQSCIDAWNESIDRANGLTISRRVAAEMADRQTPVRVSGWDGEGSAIPTGACVVTGAVVGQVLIPITADPTGQRGTWTAVDQLPPSQAQELGFTAAFVRAARTAAQRAPNAQAGPDGRLRPLRAAMIQEADGSSPRKRAISVRGDGYIACLAPSDRGGGASSLYVKQLSCEYVAAAFLTPPLGPQAPAPTSPQQAGFRCRESVGTAGKRIIAECARPDSRQAFRYLH